MDIRKARDIAYQISRGRGSRYTFEELSQAFHRLDRSQPEKQNKLIMRTDRKWAKVIWDWVGTGFKRETAKELSA